MTQVEALQDKNPPFTVVHLTGEDAFTIPIAQAGHLCDVYDIITRIAFLFYHVIH